MVRTLKGALDALPADELAAFDRSYEELVNEVESPRELRHISERSQARIAETFEISQPAVSKIEKQKSAVTSISRGHSTVSVQTRARRGDYAKPAPT
jgi:hypothetical protein